MKTIFFTMLALLFVVTLPAQKRSERKAAFNSDYNYEIQVYAIGVDGTKVYKVWDHGKKVNDAILNAKRSAVAAAIFKDIPGRSGVEGSPALCQERDAASKYADYFASFFAYGGPWQKYVNLATDTVPSGKDRVKVKGGYKVGIIVQVLYDNLRKDLENDKIVKRLDSLF